jgi:hypothetical protein
MPMRRFGKKLFQRKKEKSFNLRSNDEITRR